eukprot:gnl/TRDRNA2_/TRDRNA2_39528_c0_seq1.p1 gnl/TRDRNA2_/TRDRNA2_39528_c0~~gnl/TRDRNA2_/TRDRNA2_39528_c0_seq1.p1  ORF type:complete len:188 (-),score=20.92 gnl/TRDRNA2_/TRDRNA2_39528_c0_seq1:262-825(-)
MFQQCSRSSVVTHSGNAARIDEDPGLVCQLHEISEKWLPSAAHELIWPKALLEGPGDEQRKKCRTYEYQDQDSRLEFYQVDDALLPVLPDAQETASSHCSLGLLPESVRGACTLPLDHGGQLCERIQLPGTTSFNEIGRLIRRSYAGPPADQEGVNGGFQEKFYSGAYSLDTLDIYDPNDSMPVRSR